ncbi:unnamed protein product [Calypogeia fissa]
MSEEVLGLVIGQVAGAINEVARFLNMPSSRSQVQYGAAAAVLVGVGVALAAGGIAIYWNDGKPPWVRKKKHYPLKRQQWLESFESREGRLVDPERVISIARRGGIDKSSNAKSESMDGKRKLPASEDFLLFTIAAAVLQQRRFIIEKCRGVDEILRECNAMAGKLDIWELMDFGRELLRDYQQKVGHEKTD